MESEQTKKVKELLNKIESIIWEVFEKGVELGYEEALEWNSLEGENIDLPPTHTDVIVKMYSDIEGEYEYDVDQLLRDYDSGVYYFKNNEIDNVVAWRDI